MPLLPVPIMLALVFGYLALRILVTRDRHPALALLLGVIALQALILSYPIFWAIRPVTAAAIPPLAFVVFQVTAVRPFDPARDLWHLVAPAFTVFVVLTGPDALDGLIAGLFTVYALAILNGLRRGPDALPRASLGTGARPGLVWGLIAGAMLLSAAGDIAIAGAMALGVREAGSWIVVALTVGNLAGVGLLSLSGALAGGEAAGADRDVPDGTAPSDPALAEADAELMARIDGLMTRDRLHLDPDLSLARIARRLQRPAKQVSAAVNRVTGENVSRLVNGYRIRHACSLLAAGEPVTAAMLASGFNTKSNFNREFLRVTGASPSAWLAARTGGPGTTPPPSDPPAASPLPPPGAAAYIGRTTDSFRQSAGAPVHLTESSGR